MQPVPLLRRESIENSGNSKNLENENLTETAIGGSRSPYKITCWDADADQNTPHLTYLSEFWQHPCRKTKENITCILTSAHGFGKVEKSKDCGTRFGQKVRMVTCESEVIAVSLGARQSLRAWSVFRRTSANYNRLYKICCRQKLLTGFKDS